MKILNFLKIKGVAICNKIVRNTRWYNTELWNGAVKFWEPIEFNLDIINLGSGPSAYAFDYKATDVKGFNAALWPQSLVHSFNILKNYFSYIRNNGIVLIEVCPFTCLFTKYGKDKNLKYYTFLHPATILDFDEEERIKALRIKQSPFSYMPQYCIRQTAREYLSNAKRRLHTHTDRIDYDKSANVMMSMWKKQFGIISLIDPVSEAHLSEIESRRNTLIEMITFCKERSLSPVIVMPPFHKALRNLFPQEFDENYLVPFLEGIDAPVLSYFRDTTFQDDSQFKNAYFLNEDGAKAFTSRIIKDIRALNYNL